jgi:hypothetical protein
VAQLKVLIRKSVAIDGAAASAVVGSEVATLANSKTKELPSDQILIVLPQVESSHPSRAMCTRSLLASSFQRRQCMPDT